MADESVGLSLRPANLAVEPGAEGTCAVTVKNLGTVVERITLEVLGDAGKWATVEPATVSLLPGHEQDVTLHFRPLRQPHPHAGPIPFAVKATPQEAEGLTVVEEGEVTINPFHAVTVGIAPRTSRGRKRGRHVVRIHNGGNTPVEAVVNAADVDDLLNIHIKPALVAMGPGRRGRARVRVKVRPGSGPAAMRPFQVTVSGKDVSPVTADGFLNQRKMMSLRWVPKAVVAVAVLVVAAILYANLSATAKDHSLSPEAAKAAVAKKKKEQAKKHPPTTVKKGTKNHPTTTKPGGGPTTTDPLGATTTTGTNGTKSDPQSTEASLETDIATTCYSGLQLQDDTTNPGLTDLDGTPLAGGTPTLLRAFAAADDINTVQHLVDAYSKLCTIGSLDSTQLTFWRPAANGDLPTGTCTNYQASNLTKGSNTGTPPTTTTLDPNVPVDPNATTIPVSTLPSVSYTIIDTTSTSRFLLFTDQAARDAALKLMQSHDEICWVGGNGIPDPTATTVGGPSLNPFDPLFDWGSAVVWWP